MLRFLLCDDIQAFRDGAVTPQVYAGGRDVLMAFRSLQTLLPRIGSARLIEGELKLKACAPEHTVDQGSERQAMPPHSKQEIAS